MVQENLFAAFYSKLKMNMRYFFYAPRARTISSKAMVFARMNFEGHVHRDGKPAFLHSERVAMMLYPDKILMSIAYLHDLLEDTDVTDEQVRGIFGTRIADAVLCLTRYKGESWNNYMNKVKSNPDAVKVKIADIHDNLARMDEKMASGSRNGAMYYEALEDLKTLAA